MKKVLLINPYVKLMDGLMIQKLKEEFGEDFKLYTPEQAQSEGLKPQDFDNFPTYEIRKQEFIFKDLYSTSSKVGKGGRARNRSANKNKFHK